MCRLLNRCYPLIIMRITIDDSFYSYRGPSRVGCWLSLASLPSKYIQSSIMGSETVLSFFCLSSCSLFRFRLWWLNCLIETYPRGSYFIIHCPQTTGHGRGSLLHAARLKKCCCKSSCFPQYSNNYVVVHGVQTNQKPVIGGRRGSTAGEIYRCRKFQFKVQNTC